MDSGHDGANVGIPGKENCSINPRHGGLRFRPSGAGFIDQEICGGSVAGFLDLSCYATYFRAC